jgi:glutamate decarboxylase
VQYTCREVTTTLADKIGELGPFRLLTRGNELPVFAFTLHEYVSGYSVFNVSAALRKHGWLVPAYTFPEHRTDLAVLSIVVRNGFPTPSPTCYWADLRTELPRLGRQRLRDRNRARPSGHRRGRRRPDRLRVRRSAISLSGHAKPTFDAVAAVTAALDPAGRHWLRSPRS